MTKFHIKKEDLEQLYINEKLSLKQTAEKLNIPEPALIRYYLKKYNLKTRPPITKFLDLAGRRFGKLIAIEPISNHKKRTHWKCFCDCGKTTSVYRNSLLKGITKSCGCIRSKNWQVGYKDISGHFWYSIINNAKSRKIKVDISVKYIWNLYIKQKRKCAISGVNINIIKNYEKNRINHTASLDRIDSSKGYIKGNVQWIHKEVNKMKWAYQQEKFIEWCRIITENNRKNYV